MAPAQIPVLLTQKPSTEIRDNSSYNFILSVDTLARRALSLWASRALRRAAVAATCTVVVVVVVVVVGRSLAGGAGRPRSAGAGGGTVRPAPQPAST